jgi:hypothetical protein
MTSFKIYIGDEIRRFRLENRSDDNSYENFVEKLRQNIPSYHAEMKTFYEDGDKDKIVFSSQPEFNEMFSCLSGEPLIKIWIVDSKVPYFKDGTVEIVKLYTKGKDSVEKIVNSEEVATAQEKITSAIARLFPDNAILPYNVPSYLKEVLSVKINGPADVELDVVVDNLATSLNNEALRLMDSEEVTDLNKSKLLLESLQMINEEDPHVYYNLACVNSLLKNVHSAMEQLQNAFNHGYDNLKHMVEDKDLAYVRLQSQYSDFLQKVMPEQKFVSIKVEGPFIEEKQPVKAEEPIKEKELFPKEEPCATTVAPIAQVEPVKPKVQYVRWAEEIEVLKGMGFDREESVFLAILDHHKGNVEAALSELL